MCLGLQLPPPPRAPRWDEALAACGGNLLGYTLYTGFLLFSVFSSVLVCLGCYKKAPQTGWLTNDRSWFLTVLEARSLRSGCQYGQVLVRTPVWGADCQLLIVSSPVEREREISGSPFIRALIPFPHDPITSQMLHLQVPSHWRLDFNIWIWVEGCKPSVHNIVWRVERRRRMDKENGPWRL